MTITPWQSTECACWQASLWTNGLPVINEGRSVCLCCADHAAPYVLAPRFGPGLAWPCAVRLLGHSSRRLQASSLDALMLSFGAPLRTRHLTRQAPGPHASDEVDRQKEDPWRRSKNRGEDVSCGGVAPALEAAHVCAAGWPVRPSAPCNFRWSVVRYVFCAWPGTAPMSD